MPGNRSQIMLAAGVELLAFVVSLLVARRLPFDLLLRARIGAEIVDYGGSDVDQLHGFV